MEILAAPVGRRCSNRKLPRDIKGQCKAMLPSFAWFRSMKGETALRPVWPQYGATSLRSRVLFDFVAGYELRNLLFCCALLCPAVTGEEWMQWMQMCFRGRTKPTDPRRRASRAKNV